MKMEIYIIIILVFINATLISFLIFKNDKSFIYEEYEIGDILISKNYLKNKGRNNPFKEKKFEEMIAIKIIDIKYNEANEKYFKYQYINEDGKFCYNAYNNISEDTKSECLLLCCYKYVKDLPWENNN